MASIKWMTSGEPFSETFQDFYFSTDGGLEETEYVFLKHNDFPQRFSKPLSTQLAIGETGFGTGLNFLVTAFHFLKYARPEHKLYYIAVEKYPFSKVQLKQVFNTFKRSWPQLENCCNELLASYPDIPLAVNKSELFKLFDSKIHLNLIIDDATSGLKQHLTSQESNSKIDAWYLDGFAPAKNPEMWQPDLFKSLAQLSHTGTTISTFTSAGRVRRGLIEAGFNMSKAPGLGKKREILFGVFK